MADMAEDKPITKNDLTELSDAIIRGVEGMVNGSKKELKEEIIGVRNELAIGLKNVQRQINDLNVDTPTRKEFDNLKERVDTFHPSN